MRDQISETDGDTQIRFPRILLFDIDGTILTAVRRREYRSRIREKLEEIFGTCGRIADVDFAGKTDLGIYKEALECEGVSEGDVLRQIPVIEEAMREILLAMSKDGPVFKLCPGVQPLIETLSSDSRFVLSLLTGNFEKLAQLKLELVGVWQYFRGRGAFGSDAFERDLLPEIAAARFRESSGDDLPSSQFIIIGDTPRDIACARYFGARVLAVASGGYGSDDLAALSPDAILPDLSNTSLVVDLLATV
ncbi:MAG TPA: HAD hydrolase-like protein [Blastocatellia bacterium]